MGPPPRRETGQRNSCVRGVLERGLKFLGDVAQQQDGECTRLLGLLWQNTTGWVARTTDIHSLSFREWEVQVCQQAGFS